MLMHRQKYLDHILEYYKSFTNSQLVDITKKLKINICDLTLDLPIEMRIMILSKLHTIRQMKQMCSTSRHWRECLDSKYDAFWHVLLTKMHPNLTTSMMKNIKYKDKTIRPYYLYFFCNIVLKKKSYHANALALLSIIDKPTKLTVVNQHYYDKDKDWVKFFNCACNIDEKERKKYARRDQPIGFARPVQISNKMARFLGQRKKGQGKTKIYYSSRVDVTRALTLYIKGHNLQNPANRREIIPDNKFGRLLDPAWNNDPRGLTFMSLQRHVKHHFIKPGN